MADFRKPKTPPVQMELSFAQTPKVAPPAPSPVPAPIARSVAASTPAPGVVRGPFRVIQGEGRRTHEPLDSRDSVVRVLLEAGADLLLRRISSERADEIETRVDEILRLFDQVDAKPALMPVLKRKLDELESIMGQTRTLRTVRRGG